MRRDKEPENRGEKAPVFIGGGKELDTLDELLQLKLFKDGQVDLSPSFHNEELVLR